MIFVAIYTFIRETVKVILESIFGGQSKIVNYAGLITIALFLVVILTIFQVFRACLSSCSDRREEKKIEKIEANIVEKKVEANVLTNIQVEVENEANNSSVNTNRVLNTDSGTRQSDFSTVKRKWCADHPKDSKCR
jgi:uncharacterized membrane protein YhiD involved in acid resistance